MSGSGVKIEGLRETVRSLEKMGVSVDDLKAAFKRIGQKVADDASSRVPKLSGRLAASIRPSNTKNKSVVRAGSARVPYAGVINFGWPARSIEATGFLTDADRAMKSEALSELDQELSDLIRKYGLN